jgi:hypothetical protein
MFLFETKPSGNPGVVVVACRKYLKVGDTAQQGGMKGFFSHSKFFTQQHVSDSQKLINAPPPLKNEAHIL